MNHNDEKIVAVDFDAINSFFSEEHNRQVARNERLANLHAQQVAEASEKRKRPVVFVTTCMDERTHFIEEALGLLPGEAEVLASGGGKISKDDFERIYVPSINKAAEEGAQPVVCLSIHMCGAGQDFGCAAFKNDFEEQVRHFTDLRKEIAESHPEYFVHVIKHDTLDDALEPIALDDRDEALKEAIREGKRDEPRHGNHAHAAFGIYIGDAYRAWVENYNEYFRLSALNQALAGNIGIAVSVMKHHSTVDLSTKPVIVHIDFPNYPNDEDRTKAARENIERHVAEALRENDAAELLSAGRLKIVKTRTDMETWIGKLLEKTA